MEALDFHLQHGVVIAKPECFMMARRVFSHWPDYYHLELRAALEEDGVPDAWHVWSAAGPLAELLEIARRHPAREFTFQRRSDRLHRVAAERILAGSWASSAVVR